MAGSGRQYLIVMRHGLRQDEVDVGWELTAERPWDPPLAEAGKDEVEAAGVLLREYGIQKVVASPFLRCLQTTKCICRALNPPIDAVEIDYSMCEVLGPSYFTSIPGPAEGQSVSDWMWKGQQPEVAIRVGLGADDLSFTVPNTDFPSIPETLLEAHVRYTAAIEAAADRADGQNLLIITHGEAVGKAVTRLLPWMTVFAVKHCGFAVAWRDVDADGEWGLWQMQNVEKEAEKGVLWRNRQTQENAA